MTNHRNKQNYRFRTWKFRDRCHLKGGIRQGCFLSLVLNYLFQYIHFHSLYIMSHYYAKFKENPCVGTDASTPLISIPILRRLRVINNFVFSSEPTFTLPCKKGESRSSSNLADHDLHCLPCSLCYVA